MYVCLLFVIQPRKTSDHGLYSTRNIEQTSSTSTFLAVYLTGDDWKKPPVDFFGVRDPGPVHNKRQLTNHLVSVPQTAPFTKSLSLNTPFVEVPSRARAPPERAALGAIISRTGAGALSSCRLCVGHQMDHRIMPLALTDFTMTTVVPNPGTYAAWTASMSCLLISDANTLYTAIKRSRLPASAPGNSPAPSLLVHIESVPTKLHKPEATGDRPLNSLVTKAAALVWKSIADSAKRGCFKRDRIRLVRAAA